MQNLGFVTASSPPKSSSNLWKNYPSTRTRLGIAWKGGGKLLIVMETLSAVLRPARERILLVLASQPSSLRQSGMNHKEMPPQGTNWSLFERADGSWTSTGINMKASAGREAASSSLHARRCCANTRARPGMLCCLTRRRAICLCFWFLDLSK